MAEFRFQHHENSSNYSNSTFNSENVKVKNENSSINIFVITFEKFLAIKEGGGLFSNDNPPDVPGTKRLNASNPYMRGKGGATGPSSTASTPGVPATPSKMKK